MVQFVWRRILVGRFGGNELHSARGLRKDCAKDILASFDVNGRNHRVLVHRQRELGGHGGGDLMQRVDDAALRLLCPACVLMQMGISSADDISSYCRIPHSCAEQRSKRMNELNKRNKFYKSDLEKQVYTNFSGYIINNQK